MILSPECGTLPRSRVARMRRVRHSQHATLLTQTELFIIAPQRHVGLPCVSVCVCYPPPPRGSRPAAILWCTPLQLESLRMADRRRGRQLCKSRPIRNLLMRPNVYFHVCSRVFHEYEISYHPHSSTQTSPPPPPYPFIACPHLRRQPMPNSHNTAHEKPNLVRSVFVYKWQINMADHLTGA